MIKKYISTLLLSISFFAFFGFYSIDSNAYTVPNDTLIGYYESGYSSLLPTISSPSLNDNSYVVVGYNNAGSYNILYIGSNNSLLSFTLGRSQSVSCRIAQWNYRANDGGYLINSLYPSSGYKSQNVSAFSYSDIYILDYKNCEVYDGDILINSPLADPAPFEVTVTPELYEGMTGNTISYPSKSGGTVTDTLYDINFTVTLSDEFQELFGNSLIQDNGYSFTCFVVPSNYVSEDIDDMASHSIFNYVYYGKFTGDAYDAEFQGFGENTSLINPTDISGSAPDTSLYWHVGEGHTNILAVTCNSPVTEFSFDGNNIDYESNPADSYCVVIHACKSATDLRFAGVPSTFYYNTAYEHHFSDKGTIVTTEGEEVEYYLQYTWVSDKFSYASTPTYAPTSYETQLMSQGLTAENDPFVFTRSPSVVWDDDLMYGKDKDGNTNGVNVKGYSLDEWKEVLSSRQWSNNFNSDFGIGDVTDVLNGESGFFGFLTASFSILPSWFLTIMGSFFVTLIAIVIIKFLL